ncbi:MAG: hypothetical protein A49_10870 [Methyloceanibacter sp.]|nr:MAG: hypothetical protein A49_10870 [Methyloceanibacter sp.]
MNGSRLAESERLQANGSFRGQFKHAQKQIDRMWEDIEQLMIGPKDTPTSRCVANGSEREVAFDVCELPDSG